MKKIVKVISKNFQEMIGEVKRRASDKLFNTTLINVLIVLWQYSYIYLRRNYLNQEIPLWLTKYWGNFQLAPKTHIIIIPFISIGVTAIGLILMAFLNRYFVRYAVDVMSFVITFFNLSISYQLIRLVKISSSPFNPLLNPVFFDLAIPFIFSFILVRAVLPIFISFAKKRGLVTNPDVHTHPGMILKNPSARGGGLVYAAVFVVASLLFVSINLQLLGIFIGLFLLSTLCYLDDHQSTHPGSAFRVLENPFLRLFLLVCIVLIPVFSGIVIENVSNPFGNTIYLNEWRIVPTLVTVLWIVWVMNVMSWSNGIDGQYTGIVGIASIVIALLSLRFTEPAYRGLTTMAIISAGAAFGFVKHTWYPSKVMWGFGATLAGLVIAVLSVLSQSKITTSVLIILIPFLDALITFIRRVVQGKNPLKGDKGHLHHLLLDRGWGVQKIAVFYWVTTAMFGVLGLLLSDRYRAQAVLLAAGLVAFFIVMLNVRSYTDKKVD